MWGHPRRIFQLKRILSLQINLGIFLQSILKLEALVIMYIPLLLFELIFCVLMRDILGFSFAKVCTLADVFRVETFYARLIKIVLYLTEIAVVIVQERAGMLCCRLSLNTTPQDTFVVQSRLFHVPHVVVFG